MINTSTNNDSTYTLTITVDDKTFDVMVRLQHRRRLYFEHESVEARLVLHWLFDYSLVDVGKDDVVGTYYELSKLGLQFVLNINQSEFNI